ncbi:DUF305 domain-containing protein [Leptolyngbyaceae cyanobacterium UHCC 1019]
MPLNYFTKTGFLALTLGAIATSSVLNACSSSAQNQAQTPSATATDAGTKQMDHSNMGGMNHGDRSKGGMMDHSMMDLGPADAELDLRFIDSMIPHHQGAVVMAREVLQKSKRPELKKLAQDIIKAQEKEINQMKQWRTVWYPKAPSTPVAWHKGMNHSMAMSDDQIKAMRMDMDLGAADADFDKRFIDAMIPHHEGAVVMANDAWQKSKRPEIQKLAQGIIGSQKDEIEQMQQWRKAWYGK